MKLWFSISNLGTPAHIFCILSRSSYIRIYESIEFRSFSLTSSGEVYSKSATWCINLTRELKGLTLIALNFFCLNDGDYIEIIINVLVSSSRFISIPMLWV